MTYIAIVDEKFKIYTSKRKTYTMNEVMAKFYSSNCPKLRDTPKVFIFQVKKFLNIYNKLQNQAT